VYTPRFIDKPSPNYDQRTRPIDLVVLHYTGMQSAHIALKRLTDPAPLAGNYPGPWQDTNIDPMTVLGRVSAHYVIDEVGNIYRLVAEAHRAWHAGVSSWEGDNDTNGRSIGIEIANGGHDFDLPDFPEDQINALVHLLRDILARHQLSPSRVVGHSDVAPGRKLDPGEKFPWRTLAHYGVALAPKQAIASGGLALLRQGDSGEAVEAMQRDLARIGYGNEVSGQFDERTMQCVHAFQARYRQADVSGVVDAATRAIIADVAAQVRP
jgi:N-acetylmuramoyl-L-alanine amidase